MKRELFEDWFPESAAKEWSWIEHTLSDLVTRIGLSTEWQHDHGGSPSRDEIAHALYELERQLKDLFATETEWWSEVRATTTSCEIHQASLNRMADKRKTLLREANDLVETSKFVASGSEWEELASSVAHFRTRIAKYRSLEIQVARSLKELAPAPVQHGTRVAAPTTPGRVEDGPMTHVNEMDHAGTSHLDERRRHPKPR